MSVETPCANCEALQQYVPLALHHGPRLGDKHVCVCGTTYIWTGRWVKAPEEWR